MIWFCIDGTTKRIDQEVLGYIKSVTNDWKNVPVIIVFTKSYSSVEISENIQMANEAIKKYNDSHKKKPLNVKKIIPVVAKAYPISETVSVAPTGLDTLISETNELIPEAKKIGNDAIKEIDAKMKNAMSNALIGGATTAAMVVGAIPLQFPDATILVPIQTGMLTGVAKIYNVDDDVVSNNIIDTILKVGATTMVGKALLNAIKAIPGMLIAGAILNATVAGVITLTAGEISNVLFKKVYLNEIELSSVDWEKEITRLFDEYLPGIIDALNELSINNNGKLDINSVGEFLKSLVNTFFNKKQEEKSGK